MDRDVGNSSRKVPFSTLPENTDEESGSDIFMEGQRMHKYVKSQFHTGVKKDRISIFFRIASAKIVGS